ncbi:MAG: 2-succinyl-5-enolpyruvyl-6-hydroxy-3-cyclohexene-1-carboxylic-acid synthase [Eggerthellaceae bacterium]|nr:2-succinyl-5-enolpyruvyl-6-hydroxy-3-cyclohexene-1-carboxylic-acid synthase [Eggerthellaceae bacterium]
MEKSSVPLESALFVSAFIDEMMRCGVRDVVVSPGSRSTPLSLVAHESGLRLFVDIDERGAAFFALGLAKATGRPVALVCTSGTAAANYYPAILEAEASRVPLIVLTADRPPRLQGLGAPQTCDQVKLYGDHVRHFQQMPLPGAGPEAVAFARQMALVAFAKAVGSEAAQGDNGELWYGCISNAGPVHLNFPFDEPLKPDLQAKGLFTQGRGMLAASPVSLGDTSFEGGFLPACSKPGAEAIEAILRIMDGKRTLVCCGEGTFTQREETACLLDWARAYQLPLLADPLSNLRSVPDTLVIDNYDKAFASADLEELGFEVLIRFGRYPVSKSCSKRIAATDHIQIVVDACETRDFNAATDVYVPTTPRAFVEAFCAYAGLSGTAAAGLADTRKDKAWPAQKKYAKTWITRNDAEAWRIIEDSDFESGFEGAFVRRLMEIAPEGSCLFAANSLAIRLIDTFYLKTAKHIDLLCNRGLSGIDGTLSSALGAAQAYGQTTLLTGDLAFLHDLSALMLQRELLCKTRSAAEGRGRKGQASEGSGPGIVAVVLNNQGGAIFDLLPQSSDDPYFERLFTTPQQVDLSQVAAGFDIPFTRVETLAEFEAAYRASCGNPGLHLVEVMVEPGKLKDYYGEILA